ncbi:SF1B family DNA helicase RecD2 [Leptolyngbya sp. AN03gr2]|uniref:SF1B family DNA helicase RecD2 n=1 Tax=unclassified Leptolyngbya TaxID=2650499 RepID=UPI003D320099
MDTEELVGSIESIVFSSADTGFTVARLQTAAEETVTIVGNFAALNQGQPLILAGTWRTHPRYGAQFQVQHYRENIPDTIAGIETYLGSGIIRGIGPAMAKRIVDRFGLDTLTILDTEIERLIEVKGIAQAKLAQIRSTWIGQRQLHTIMIFLQTYGIAKSQAVRVLKHYGEDAIAIVSNNPFQLAAEIRGIGFHSADGIATQLGIAPDSEYRYRSAILHSLREAGRDGHCFLPHTAIVDRTVRLLARADYCPQAEVIEQQLAWLVAAEELRVEESRKYPGRLGYYLPAFYRAETAIASRLKQRLNQAAIVDGDFVQTWMQQYCEASDVPLSIEQRQAVVLAASERVVILTGGPGVGKSHTVRAIVELWEAMGKRVALASPTGRAARRLTELSGRQASTLHRLLEYEPRSGDFQRDETRPISADCIVVDEFSMADLFLAHALMKAVSIQSQLLIVGDVDQLPSVGPGAVLRELIASQQVPVVRLTQVWRQAQNSAIVRQAHAINRGELLEIERFSPSIQSDCIWMPSHSPQHGIECIRQLIGETIPQLGWNAFNDVQILCPMIKGEIGTKAINTMMQDLLNPSEPQTLELQSEGLMFRVGDRVIQLENDYEREVMNGELGVIETYDAEAQVLGVQFEDHWVEYQRSEWDQMSLAYGITGHKAQGSEFPVTIVPLFMQNAVMLSRPWLYTTLTRAKHLAILVGQPQALRHAIAQCREQRRYTLLSQRLQEQAEVAKTSEP